MMAGPAPGDGAAGWRLEDAFDCVIFLTQSDWRTEPRSNRYHYATRFAARLPVYFVQPDAPHTALFEEESDYPGISLVHCSWHTDDPAPDAGPRFARRGGSTSPSSKTPAQALKAFFRSKGISRPLVWIYNANYRDFILAIPEWFRAYHATEDYTLGEAFIDAPYRLLTLEMLRQCDLMVAVSDAVRANYMAHAGFQGVAVTLANGCDYSFWRRSGAFDYRPAPRGLLSRLGLRRRPPRPIVLYQGGINGRLDFAMLNDLAGRMLDFQFNFCGLVDERSSSRDAMAGWRDLLQRPNVDYLGLLSAEAVAAEARKASVGISPFLETPLIAVSLPLKSYEYLACGLPVVTPPIAALAHDAEHFTFAHTAQDYEAAIRRLAPTRADPAAVAARLAAAARMDYDRRFEELEAAIRAALANHQTPLPAAEAPIANAGPTAPPSDAVTVAEWGPSALVCYDVWRNAGAEATTTPQGTLIRTPARAWDYAGALPLDMSGLDLDHSHASLSVEVEAVEGQPMIGLLDESGEQLLFEAPLDPGPDPAEYLLDIQPHSPRLLLFRNGAQDDRSVVRFVRARLLTWPKIS